MNLSAPFIRRPVATSLLGFGLVLAGALALRQLPVAPLPQVNVPTIKVTAALPGASPQAMAALVATPLEHSLGRIAGVTEMTSTSEAGVTAIRLTFDLDRNVDGAARDVQAALNAARGELPAGMPANPSYRAVTSADRPILVLGLTSASLTPAQMYAAAAGRFSQALSHIPGVGQVELAGGSPPAVRVELDPSALHRYGIDFERVRAAIQQASPDLPAGSLEIGDRQWQIATNARLRDAAAVKAIIVAHADGAAVRLDQVATVREAEQDRFTAGRVNGQPGVLVLVRRNPDANILQTVERITRSLPELRTELPHAMEATVVVDRTATVRASLRDAEYALAIAIALVVLVMLAFLRNVRSAIIASAAAPIALIGTLAVMYGLGYSLDNLSLMALTIAVGFAVDDAVVVVENISRHLEAGLPPAAAARQGAGEIGLTVLSMSAVLVAAFIPLLLMGGYAGLFVREFAVTLAVVVVISLIVALTIVPMLCAWLLQPPRAAVGHGRLYRWSERGLAALLRAYTASLDWVLGHAALTLLALGAIVGLNVYLFVTIPKGFFPRQDTGELSGDFSIDDSGSFRLAQAALTRFVDTVRADPAVASVAGFAGRDSGSLFANLKPQAQREASADAVAARLNGRLAAQPGVRFSVQAVQDIRLGGRRSRASDQYTIEADSVAELDTWVPRIQRALAALPQLRDVQVDTRGSGLDTALTVDRDAATRLGVSLAQIDGTLHDAFAQRQVATVFAPGHPQRVVMAAAPEHAQSARALEHVEIANTGGKLVPLPALARHAPREALLAIDHQGLFVSATITFNPAAGVSLSQATHAIQQAVARLALPMSVRGSFEGSARAFRAVASSEPVLIVVALVTLFIVLGVLYESYAHPLTILSTLPSAGVGALLALLLCGRAFGVIALIGIFALIGIVMKNAIMLVDFALAEQRHAGVPPHVAIRRACLLRFRPILMTSLAVMLAAIPLALGHGNGAEMRQPLGIAMGGGLVMSQLLTLYTTPVVYLYLNRFGAWLRRTGHRHGTPAQPANGSTAA